MCGSLGLLLGIVHLVVRRLGQSVQETLLGNVDLVYRVLAVDPDVCTYFEEVAGLVGSVHDFQSFLLLHSYLLFELFLLLPMLQLLVFSLAR